jgi:hypothetical protein
MRPYGSFCMILATAAMVAGLTGCQSSKNREQKTSSGTPTTEAAISGTITLDPALKDKIGSAPLLMIMASQSSDPSKPAVVVKREANASFPYQYKLTADDITLVGSSFLGRMYVSARIDPAGMVGPPHPGIFEGSYSRNPVEVGSSKVDITIDKAY